MTVIDGYVIAGGTGMFLNRKLGWDHKTAAQSYVFSVAMTEKILARAKKDEWKVMPTQIIPATHTGRKRDHTKVFGPGHSAY